MTTSKLDSRQILDESFDLDKKAIRITQDLTESSNLILKDSVGFASITNSYALLASVPSGKTFNHLILINKTDAEIYLELEDGSSPNNEINVIPSFSVALDNLAYSGNINIKYNGSAPTTGTFYLMGW